MLEDIIYAALTDVGKERSENQDNYGEARLDRYEFFYVCDGMGGHAGGSTASRLGVDTIHDVLRDDQSLPVARMEKAIDAANHAIFGVQVQRVKLRGMGTTVVAVSIDKEKGEAYVSHVGDSRVYMLRGQRFRRLTRDHTMVQRLVDDGVLAPEDAEKHPNANVISRSLGGKPEVEVEHGPEPIVLEEGDTFLLCSDGLCGLVPEREMALVLAKEGPDQAVETLVAMANNAGGHDNITVEIIRIGSHAKTNPAEPIALIHPEPGPSAKEIRERESEEQRVIDEGSETAASDETNNKDNGSDHTDNPGSEPERSAPSTSTSPDKLRKKRKAELKGRHQRTRSRLKLTIMGLLIILLVMMIIWLLKVGMGMVDATSATDFLEWAYATVPTWEGMTGQ